MVLALFFFFSRFSSVIFKILFPWVLPSDLLLLAFLLFLIFTSFFFFYLRKLFALVDSFTPTIFLFHLFLILPFSFFQLIIPFVLFPFHILIWYWAYISRWGFDLYPERRGEKYKPSMAKIALLGEGRELRDKMKCEKNVWNCAQTSKHGFFLLIKKMVSVLFSLVFNLLLYTFGSHQLLLHYLYQFSSLVHFFFCS